MMAYPVPERCSADPLSEFFSTSTCSTPATPLKIASISEMDLIRTALQFQPLTSVDCHNNRGQLCLRISSPGPWGASLAYVRDVVCVRV